MTDLTQGWVGGLGRGHFRASVWKAWVSVVSGECAVSVVMCTESLGLSVFKGASEEHVAGQSSVFP